MSETLDPSASNLWDELAYFEELPSAKEFGLDNSDCTLSDTSEGLQPIPTNSFFAEPLTKEEQHLIEAPVKSLPGPGSAPGGPKEEENFEENDPELKRKAAVAAASRATRAKKKKEMDELRRRNVELMKERRALRGIIGDLQLRVQANRKAGVIDLQAENELLKAELNEHKNFLAQFKRVADGMPATQTGKRVMCTQGADAAIGQVLGLLNTSTIDPTWKVGISRTRPEFLIHYQRLPHGASAAKATRINIRSDAPVLPIPPEEIMKIQWSIWTSPELSARMSSHFGTVEREIQEIDTGLEGVDLGEKRQLKVYYYREKRKPPTREQRVEGDEKAPEHTISEQADRVFLVTSKHDLLPYNGTPTDNPWVNQSASSKSAAPKPPEVFPTTIVVTTSTQHSKDIKPERTGVQRINSLLIESVIIREVAKNCSSVTMVNSYPLNPVDGTKSSDFLSSTLARGWIGDDGYFTERADETVNELIKIFTENVSVAAKNEYMQVAQGVQAPK